MGAMPERTTPFELLGGEAAVRKLVEHFYDAMRAHEPALADLHQCDPDGRVKQEMRDRFALFLIGWLGGPQDSTATHGHPRLRMRHAHVPVDEAMRDAWTRSMKRAMDECGVAGEVRAFLDTRFADVAEFLRNVTG
jgi:hemoglobin